MPYRMTPSVRHRAIEVHTEHCSVWSYQFYWYYYGQYGQEDEKGRFLRWPDGATAVWGPAYAFLLLLLLLLYDTAFEYLQRKYVVLPSSEWTH